MSLQCRLYKKIMKKSSDKYSFCFCKFLQTVLLVHNSRKKNYLSFLMNKKPKIIALKRNSRFSPKNFYERICLEANIYIIVFECDFDFASSVYLLPVDNY